MYNDLAVSLEPWLCTWEFMVHDSMMCIVPTLNFRKLLVLRDCVSLCSPSL